MNMKTRAMIFSHTVAVLPAGFADRGRTETAIGFVPPAEIFVSATTYGIYIEDYITVLWFENRAPDYREKGVFLFKKIMNVPLANR